MRELQFPFRKNGWTHELVKRAGMVCLIARSKKGIPVHYEVVILQQSKDRVFRLGYIERNLPEMEVYPSAERWGTYGFTYRSLDVPERGWTALSRFESLAQKYGFTDEGAPAELKNQKEMARDGG